MELEKTKRAIQQTPGLLLEVQGKMPQKASRRLLKDTSSF